MAWEGIRGGDSKEEPVRGEVGVGLAKEGGASQGGQGLALEQARACVEVLRPNFGILKELKDSQVADLLACQQKDDANKEFEPYF